MVTGIEPRILGCMLIACNDSPINVSDVVIENIVEIPRSSVFVPFRDE